MFSYPIVIRMDDICPKMNFEKFQKYKKLFDSFGIKPLIGVIPDCMDQSFKNIAIDDFWQMVRDLKLNGWDIAMHGYHHVYSSSALGLVCKRPKSEFAGLPYQKQVEMLENGRRIFSGEGIDVDTFMPPGHSYDKNTLKAMNVVGFKYLTDGRSLMPYVLENIKCIPASPAYKLHFCGILTICVHCETEKEKDFIQLASFIEKHKNRIISFENAKKLRTNRYSFSRFEELVRLFIYYNIVPVLVKLIKKKR